MFIFIPGKGGGVDEGIGWLIAIMLGVVAVGIAVVCLISNHLTYGTWF